MRTIQATSLNYNGTEIVLVLADWASVKRPADRPVVLRTMAAVFPGKHVLLVSKDPLKSDAPAEFFGHAQLTALFAGRRIADFKWSTVKY